MCPRKSNRPDTRERIAAEAARLMLEGGHRDYEQAKCKAAAKLHVNARRALPRNEDIERAIEAHQRLFDRASHPQHLRRLRQSAVQAMRFMECFEPRLVGAVLSGTADQNSPVSLHVFGDPPESVALFLADNAIPYEHRECVSKLSTSTHSRQSLLTFLADDVAIELVVFDRDSQKNPPLDPVTGKRIKRADVTSVEFLLERSTQFHDW